MHDATTHCNWECQLLELHLDPQRTPVAPGIVVARLISLQGPSKIKKAKKAGERERTPAQLAYEKKVKDLKVAIYGPGAGRKAKGSWSIAASDIMRAEHDWMAKFAGMRRLTEKVMGKEHYLPSPVCAVCPFVGDGCCDDESCRRLNGICSFSQLYSHGPGLHGPPRPWLMHHGACLGFGAPLYWSLCW